MPYRKPTGNAKPDFAVQIFIPNGDDGSKPNSMFYRTSLADSWNAWQEAATTDELNKKFDYGTQLGVTATWNTDIPKSDKLSLVTSPRSRALNKALYLSYTSLIRCSVFSLPSNNM